MISPLIIVFIFFLIGACFGSFSTVLIERWKHKKWGILFGRSECPSCHHTLQATELVPFFSYLFQRGRCKNCGKSIPLFYPIAEWVMGIIFALMSWVALSFDYIPTDIMWWIFIVWWFITGVYILYDMRYMEIPDEVMIPGIYGTFLLLIGWIFFENFRIQFDLSTYYTFHTFLTDHISWAIILYSFLYLQILIPGGFYLLKQKKKKDVLLLLMSYFAFPFTILIDFFWQPSSESWPEIPAWVGWGDLRVALFVGVSLWTIHGIASFFFAYMVWSIVWIFILYKHRKQKWKWKLTIPFWPFLGIGWILSLLTYNQILNLLNI